MVSILLYFLHFGWLSNHHQILCLQEARNKAETKEKELEMKKRKEIDERIENEKRAAILEVTFPFPVIILLLKHKISSDGIC